MKKLLLTSSGLDSEKIKQAFYRLLNKPVSESRILVIDSAEDEEERGWIKSVIEEL